jgi:hypothetical protein
MTLFASLAGASIITVSPCSVIEDPNSGPSSSGNCSATADPGFFINSVNVTITSDFTGYQSGTPTITYTYAFDINTAGFGAIPNGVITTTGGKDPVQNFDATLNGNFGSTVIETFNVSNTVVGGAVTGASGVLTITATETEIPSNNVPEPVTLSLIGSGLLGLGLLRRRHAK